MAKQKPRDPNLVLKTVDAAGIEFVDALTHPAIELEGFPYRESNGNLCRLPVEIVPELPELMQWVCWHSAGGAIRFRTDSPQVHIRVRFNTWETGNSTTLNSLSGFDAYRRVGTRMAFQKTLYAQPVRKGFTDGIARGIPKGMHDWQIYFPLRNHIVSLELGLAPGSALKPPRRYALDKPVLFYGSSIVEGGCASRGGLTYPAAIGRDLNVYAINYGFGGSARGELSVAGAIAGLDLAAVVIDYDHNTPSVEHLRKTHWPFFRRIRKTNPDLPIIVASSVDYRHVPEMFEKRARIIQNTCRKARAAGDRKVWFIHGKTIFPKSHWGDCTVDLTHPNDYGFRCMADAIGGKLRDVLKLA